jgi:hypothetical protein
MLIFRIIAAEDEYVRTLIGRALFARYPLCSSPWNRDPDYRKAGLR